MGLDMYVSTSDACVVGDQQVVFHDKEGYPSTERTELAYWRERAAFEEWFTKTKAYISDPKHIMAQVVKDIAWEAWQARSALQSQELEGRHSTMNTEHERIKFEAACHRHAEEAGYEGAAKLERDGDGYADPATQAAWWGWREGRAALQSQEREDGFSDGVLLALQMMTSAGYAGSHLHFELIKTAGLEKIVRRALQEEMWELAGLDAPMSQSAREAIDHARRTEG